MTTVLVVDDDPLELELLSEMLIRLGYKTVASASLRRARAHLMSSRFDLVISDLAMPGGSGFDLLETMRERKIDTPFIAVTGCFGGDMDARIAVEGPVVLRKPVECRELKKLLVRVGVRGRKS